MIRSALALVWILVCARSALAQLKWEHERLEFTPSITDRTTVGEYPFENVGPKPVTITSIDTSCGCTTAKLDKKTYAPGEKGKIVATFTHEQRTGLQEKAIIVNTDAAEDPTILRLIVHLPKFIDIAPRAVLWRVGQSASPKTVEVKMSFDDPVKLSGVKSDSDAFRVELKEVEKNETYDVIITPSDTGKPAKGTIDLITDLPPEHQVGLRIFARIIPPGAAAPTTEPTR